MLAHARWHHCPLLTSIGLVLACKVSVAPVAGSSAVDVPGEGTGSIRSSILADLKHEADAVAALEGATPDAVRGQLPFAEVERLIQRGWWKAAVAAVESGHRSRVDLTAPVRRAVGEVKREADSLLQWLDPEFAHPKAIAMAARWTQNATAVLIAARFSPKWNAPGANLAVYTTAQGKGHIDQERTADAVNKLLAVNITSSRLEAEIIAKAANARKRYHLVVDLFDEILPERSFSEVGFVQAAGSMQMSTGAQVPELRFQLRKRWPTTAIWPRLFLSENSSVVELEEWLDAPGKPQALRKGNASQAVPHLRASVLTCQQEGSTFYCGSSDVCMASCGSCQHKIMEHALAHRCIGPPWIGSRTQARFLDSDQKPGTIGGLLQWPGIPERAAESYTVLWASSSLSRLPGLPPVLVSPELMDPQPSVVVPNGTVIPEGATALLVVASNMHSEADVAGVKFWDAVKPPPLLGIRFTDDSPTLWAVSGEIEIDPPVDQSHVSSYEVHLGRINSQGLPEKLPGVQSLVATLSRETFSSPEPLAYRMQREVTIKPGTIMIAVSKNPDAESEPIVLRFADNFSPTMSAREFKVRRDANPKPGVLSVDVVLKGGKCASHKSTKKGKTGKRGTKDEEAPETRGSHIPAEALAGVGGKHSPEPCDSGKNFVLYWVHKDGSNLGLVAEVAASPKAQVHRLQAVEIPEGAKKIIAIPRNVYGESAQFGVVSNFTDNIGDGGRDVQALAATETGPLILWRPQLDAEEPRFLRVFVNSKGQRTSPLITALAMDESGTRALCGRQDGSVVEVDLIADKVTFSFDDRESFDPVTALAYSFTEQLAARGTQRGHLSLWDLHNESAPPRAVRRHRLTGHSGAVNALQARWPEELLSAGDDGLVILWDAGTGVQKAVLTPTRTPSADGPIPAAKSVDVDWPRSRVLSASADETLRLFDIEGSGQQISEFEGHSDAVGFVVANWTKNMALSFSHPDNSFKYWNLTTRECSRTIGIEQHKNTHQLVALHADWEFMLAMAIFVDGEVQLLDLRVAEVPSVVGPVAAAGRAISVATVGLAPVDVARSSLGVHELPANTA